jgi:hypothetical protein
MKMLFQPWHHGKQEECDVVMNMTNVATLMNEIASSINRGNQSLKQGIHQKRRKIHAKKFAAIITDNGNDNVHYDKPLI